MYIFLPRIFFGACRARNRWLLAAALFAGPGLTAADVQVDLAAVRKLADQGDAEALNVLGNAFSLGRGVAQDHGEALKLFRQAADRGLGVAHFNLGMAYELGQGVPADLAAAFGHYRKAAEAGFAPAQFNVGNMYANGLGVAVDLFEAALWFRRGADSGVPEAQFNLGLAYELGRGVGRDDIAAQKWYRAAAGQNYPRACYNLALMVEEGRGGPADRAAAEELYRRAALQNFAAAQNNLGIMLAEGRGAPADPIQAYAWLALAVENGAKPVGRDTLAQQFTSAQLAEANVAAARLRALLQRRDPVTKKDDAPSVAVAPSPAAAAPAVSGAASESELATRLATTQAELAELLVEYGRLTGVAQGLSREKTTLEQRLSTIADRTDPPPTPAAPSAEVSAKLNRLQDALDDARTENARLTAAGETSKRERAGFDERLATAAQLLEKERALFKERLAAAEARAATDRAANSATTFPDPAVEPLRAQVAQLTREVASLRAEKEQMQAQLADLTTQLAAARAAPAAPALARTPAATGGGSEARVAQLLADNARLNDEIRRSIVQLAAMNRQLRAAQAKAAKDEVPGPAAAPAAAAGTSTP